MSDSKSDIIVIGGGMAGAAVAVHLSQHARVQLLEMEAHPGYHSTGRSAALFYEGYGNSVIRALTRASRAFFFSPPAGFCETALVKPRPVLMIGEAHQRAILQDHRDSLDAADPAEFISTEAALQLCPIVRPEHAACALFTSGPADIEVHELQQGYLRLLKARGGQVATEAEVIALGRRGGDWEVRTRGGDVYQAPTVVNAAGAWAGRVGAMAGAQDIGMVPCRRTAVLIDAPSGYDTQSWPLLIDVEERFYLKPDAGLLLLSPADETPAEPGDAQPEELDIAIAVDRLQTATTLEVRRIRRKWAGLRSFVADRSPVVGYDARQPGFFWLAALGGYGIQTAPALSELAARLVLAQAPGEDIERFGVDVARIDPARLGSDQP